MGGRMTEALLEPASHQRHRDPGGLRGTAVNVQAMGGWVGEKCRRRVTSEGGAGAWGGKMGRVLN
jgi:hypothetical protein